MRILITGCRGFIGGAIGRLAANEGHEVLGISRGAQPPVGWLGGYTAADVVTADLSSIIREFVPGAIFHAAGTASVGRSFVAPIEDLRAAVLAWANVLDGVRRSGVRSLVMFPSSAAVYGNPGRLPVNEDASTNPISPYGFHKAACELIAREYTDCFGLRVLICRFFSLFGETQRRLFVWEMYRQLAGDESTVWLQGTGRETRDYLHVDDASAAILSLLERQIAKPESQNYQILNVASGKEINVLKLAEEIRDFVAPEKRIECRGEVRAGDPPDWRADISRLRAMIPDWRPQSFAARLVACIASWQKER